MLQQLLLIITSEILTILGIGFLAVLLFVVSYAAHHFAQHEKWRSLSSIWVLIDEVLIDAITTVAFNEIDFEIYNDIAAEYAVEYDKELDFRMAYVLKQAEHYVEQYVPFDFDFIIMYNRAERLYSRIKPEFDARADTV